MGIMLKYRQDDGMDEQRMKRPQSIIWFERVFLASVALNIFLCFYDSREFRAVIRNMFQSMWTSGLAITLFWTAHVILCFFVSRKSSNFWKKAFVIIISIYLILNIFLVIPDISLHKQRFRNFLTPFLISNIILCLLMIRLLFRPDARAWFRGEPTNLVDVFS